MRKACEGLCVCVCVCVTKERAWGWCGERVVNHEGIKLYSLHVVNNIYRGNTRLHKYPTPAQVVGRGRKVRFGQAERDGTVAVN